MRLATKLALAISAVFAFILIVSSALIATDEIGFVDEQVARHGRLLARVVASTVEQTWEEEGEIAARHLLDEIDLQEERIFVRWVSLNPTDDDSAPGPRVDEATRWSLSNGQVVNIIGGRDADTLYTYAPLDFDGYTRAVEIGSSLTERNAHVRGVQLLLLGVGLVGFGTSTLVAYLLGRRYVTNPVADLIAMARRVGQGDFSQPAPQTSQDEIGVLAGEMNQMSADLAESERHAAELEQSRRRAEQQLEHAERLATVGQLAAGVAHEIGTPLQSISLRSSLIASRAGHIEGVLEFTQAIEAQSRRVADIVRNLLSFARRRPLISVRRDLREVVNDAVTLVESAHPSSPVHIERKLPPVPVLADADAQQLSHVITNLLINAMHAMPNGGRLSVGVGQSYAHPPAELSASSGEYSCLWVEDEGTGISPDVLPHLFEPFFTTKAAGKGTGLGLSIVYGIIKEHAGWIDVKTRLGAGTRFTVYLPIAKPSAQSDSSPHENT